MKTAENYAIRTYKAEELISHVKTGEKDGFKDEANNWYPKFEIDMSANSLAGKTALKSEENCTVNALFYQLAVVLSEKLEDYSFFKEHLKLIGIESNEDLNKYESDFKENKEDIISHLAMQPDFLKYYFFFVDCDNIYKNSFVEREESDNKEQNDSTAESKKKNNRNKKKKERVRAEDIFDNGRLKTVKREKFKEELEKLPVTKFGFLFETGKFSSANSEDKNNCKFEEGLYISYLKKDDKNEFNCFKPFDKSNSMARRSRISFIRSDVKKELEKRLLLGYHNPGEESERKTFDNIEVIPSKFYAYRGLYLTDSYRMDELSGLLNEETVVIINDDVHEVIAKKPDGSNQDIYLFGDKEEDRVKLCKGNNVDVKWEFKSYSEEKHKINPSDGEGLICFEYAEKISDTLLSIKNSPYKSESTSFQIRMPFTKGMLHKVDFVCFIDEYMYGKDIPPEKERAPLYIRDVYGIERDLRKAKIILTDNLFKGKKWLGTLVGSGPVGSGYACDPVKKYFELFKKYNHAMYVANTDALLDSGNKNKKTVLNYQFLSTLMLDDDGMIKLIDKHFNAVTDVEKDLREEYKKSSIDKSIEDSSVNNDEKADEEIDFSGDELIKETTYPILCSYAYDEKFYNDISVRKLIKGKKEGMVKNIGLGRILTDGECRFLSGDLLAFMKHIVRKLNLNEYDEKTDKETIEKIVDLKNRINNLSAIYADRFFIPSNNIELKPNYYYALLRSPHLSRNEQCILRPYLQDKNGLYNKYFGHLKGIVMISRNSLVADTLSGADYDGDLVKVYSDGTLVNAIKEGCYEDAKDKKDRIVYARKKDMPTVVIPDVKTSGQAVTNAININYNTIFNTFSNQIGHISNLAVKAAKKEYGRKPDPEFENCCAALTSITGLEIDAAKTGIHPRLAIEEIENKFSNYDKNDGSEFIKFKNLIADLKPHEYKITKTSDDKITVDVVNVKGKPVRSETFDFSNPETFLDKIPSFLCEIMQNAEDVPMPTTKERFEVFSRVLGIKWLNLTEGSYSTYSKLDKIYEALGETDCSEDESEEEKLDKLCKKIKENGNSYKEENLLNVCDLLNINHKKISGAHDLSEKICDKLSKVKNSEYSKEELQKICHDLGIKCSGSSSDLKNAINEELKKIEYSHQFIEEIAKDKGSNDEFVQLAKVRALMAAYNYILRYSKEINQIKNMLGDSGYINYIYPYLQAQYNAFDGNLLVSFNEKEETVETVLNDAYDYLISKFSVVEDDGSSSADNAENAFRRFLASNWAFTEKAKRKDKLYQIINGDTELETNYNDDKENEMKEYDDVYDLLTNFYFRGYKILYYLLKDVYLYFMANSDTFEKANKIKEFEANDKSRIINREAYEYYVRHRNVLKEKYTKNSMNSRKWKEDVNYYCKQQLWTILSGKKVANITAFKPDDKLKKKALAFVFYNYSYDTENEDFLTTILKQYYNSFEKVIEEAQGKNKENTSNSNS